MSSQRNTYHPISIAMHWLMLLLIVAVYACIELREIYPKGSDPREALKQWHFMLGLLVGMLVLIRIYFRLTTRAPAIEPAPSALQIKLAGAMHGLLYLLMLGLPVAGWLILSAAGKSIPFFGLTLPPLVAENRELAGMVKEWHETIGQAGYFLIGLHAFLALWHHYGKKDNTLLRMLPGKK
ncbi:cytochrome b [Bowmanella yangjiangensis]|uniref:Cytochrome b n=1 Tax=Bowmanella yangjiangensis TaxID=2811230 RepID=A0ABS3CWW0_9ALTE|nr:cytochrome b [Bowmanella yangjiangensis]MBN7821614.1 cytochrome b [Bowmanella yangjiangensis]